MVGDALTRAALLVAGYLVAGPLGVAGVAGGLLLRIGFRRGARVLAPAHV